MLSIFLNWMSARATDEQFLAKSNTGSLVITSDGDMDLGLAQSHPCALDLADALKNLP